MAYTHIALITGANQGIGFETAKKLAEEHGDYHVIMTGRRKEAIEEAAAKIAATGTKNVEPLVLDVRSDESIDAAVKYLEQKYGRLDVLINNAGIAYPGGPASRQIWLDVLDTNVVSVALITDAFIQLLEKSQVTKRIVNVSSNMSSITMKLDPASHTHKLLTSTKEYGPYTSSKPALNMLTAHYVTRYMDDPTWKINITCPGYCATNINSFAGTLDSAVGAINSVRLATLGPDGPTGTFTDKDGPIDW
ncbi:short chain dehydrogenase reductase [Immersiella caudata]|uniref:Short chain dehydrogenase reductase n=1 Tax=Immersiella caudata TaxID=314043 RepID=A0AA40CCY1_9PEZI|nr:short chain dehydrogenase reductase [Immersiella caudata]